MHPTHTSINHRQSEVPSRRCSTRKSTRAAEHPSRRNAKGYLRQLYVTAISGTNSLGPDRTGDFAKRIYNRHSCASVINSRTNRKAKAYWRSHASKAPRSLSAKHLLDDTAVSTRTINQPQGANAKANKAKLYINSAVYQPRSATTNA